LHATLPPLQLAGPTAQRENCVQQPDVAQSQVPGSTNTEWHPTCASQSACVVRYTHIEQAPLPVQRAVPSAETQLSYLTPPPQAGQ
jgi:hypothetical protein